MKDNIVNFHSLLIVLTYKYSVNSVGIDWAKLT